MLVLTSIGVSIGAVVSTQYAASKRASYTTSAVMVAEAGISDTIARLHADSSFTGYPDGARKQLFSSAEQGKGEYSTVVTAPTIDTRTITSAGYLYKNPASTANEIKKTIKVTLKANVNPKKYSIFAGAGGLTVNWGVTLLGSDIYVLGKVDLGFGSGIGIYSSPVNLYAANVACRAGGAGSEYPVLCPVSSPPLTLAGAGTFSSIYGEVCATGQTSGLGINKGVIGQGFRNPCTAPSGSIPLFDKAAFTSSMSTPAQPASSALCSFPSNKKTWNANTKFSGDVTAASVCKVTVKGNIYIDGDLTTNLFLHFQVDEDVTVPPVIVVNGTVAVNFSRVSANSAGVPMRIISFDSTDSTCSSSDSCNVLPNYDDKYNSVSKVTASCAGSPHGDMPGLIFQAYYGKANVGLGCNAGSVAGQAVNFDAFSGTSIVGELSLDGSVTIDGWKIVDYQQIY